MHKYSIRGVAVAVACVLALSGARAQEVEPTPPPARRFSRMADLDGRRVGIMVGTILDAAVERHLDYVQIKYYDNYHVMEKALKAGEIDALIGDHVILQQIAVEDPSLRILEDSLPSQAYGFGFRYEDKELYGRFNANLARLHNAEYIDFLTAKWVDGGPEDKFVLESPQRETTQILRMGTCPVSPPFTYVGEDGEIIGFDIELAGKIAQLMNRRLVVVEMEFGELIPSLLAGEVDLIGACVSITPDRLRVINFTDGYYRTGVGAMVREDATEGTQLMATENKGVER